MGEGRSYVNAAGHEFCFSRFGLSDVVGGLHTHGVSLLQRRAF